MQQSRFNAQRTFIALIACVAAVAGIFWLVAHNKTPSEQVRITNLSDCAPKINGVISSQISTNMYKFVERANTYNKRENLKNYDGQFREKTCRTITTNEDSKIFNTTAILDIPEAKQSWKVSFGWTSTKGNPQIDLGTIKPTCLLASQLLYGDFECINVWSLITYGTDKYDPILKHVPYNGSSFDLAYDPETKTISATVLIRPNDANNPAVISNTEAAVPIWLQNEGLNPADYTIKYRVTARQD